MRIVQTSLKDIKPYSKNPRNNKDAVDQVAESIKNFGFVQPLVLDKKNIIVIGHTRFLAAKELGLKKVPVVIAGNLSPKKIKALRIADNKVGEISEWDFDLLKDELDGRKKMARSLADQHPGIVDIVWKFNKWHHQVSHTKFKLVKPILKDNINIENGINNYGMKLKKVK